MRIDASISSRRGSVLLEVVLALALFVGAATIITTGINASIQSTQRLRLQTHAVNLAVSVMSEMQMHVRPVAAIGPENFPAPFQDWNYQIEVTQSESALPDVDAPRPVEVIVRHSSENIVHRITELFRSSEISGEGTNFTAEPFTETTGRVAP